MVYLISDLDETRVKIGISTNVDQRFKNLQSINLIDLKIVKTFDGDMNHEYFLHQKFSKYKIKNEIFEFSQEIKDFINKNDAITFPEEIVKETTANHEEIYNKVKSIVKNYKNNENIKSEFLLKLNNKKYLIILDIIDKFEEDCIFGFASTNRNKVIISKVLNIKQTCLEGMIYRLKRKNFLIQIDRLWYKVNKDIFIDG